MFTTSPLPIFTFEKKLITGDIINLWRNVILFFRTAKNIRERVRSIKFLFLPHSRPLQMIIRFYR